MSLDRFFFRIGNKDFLSAVDEYSFRLLVMVVDLVLPQEGCGLKLHRLKQ
ncbi:MAG: hypothetical protein SP1CHLAM54_03560 [Chlamydiia bacterium]|nr:hypothetical protein [Chlamydiia bacterium]MCH9615272.1 hypothetical protein [Chlamydiia bacterium]MCH9628406.1 hypothetical protein [Chlamydiia bacterium]